jgi:hypothetical protein
LRSSARCSGRAPRRGARSVLQAEIENLHAAVLQQLAAEKNQSLEQRRFTQTPLDDVKAAFSPALPTAIVGATAGPVTYAVLRKFAPRLAVLRGAQVGARQLGLGALNLDANNERSSFDKFSQKLMGMADQNTPR